jgi:ornithine--oxo-acid transaminase
MKLARRWGYMKKGIPKDKAIILSVTNNFHGRTIGVISMSTDPECRENFGPFLPRVGPICPRTSKGDGPLEIRFGHIEDLEAALEKHGKEVAAFLFEPIQGEAGIIVPPKDYLSQVQALCKKHNVRLGNHNEAR